MAKRAPVLARPDRTLVPELRTESVYLGIDMGTSRHVVGFLSATLLLERLRHFCPLEHALVLLERTGH